MFKGLKSILKLHRSWVMRINQLYGEFSLLFDFSKKRQMLPLSWSPVVKLKVHYVIFSSANGDSLCYQTGLAKKNVWRKERDKESCLGKKKRSRSTVVTQRGGRGLQTAKQMKVTAVLMVLHRPKAKGGGGSNLGQLAHISSWFELKVRVTLILPVWLICSFWGWLITSEKCEKCPGTG